MKIADNQLLNKIVLKNSIGNAKTTCIYFLTAFHFSKNTASAESD